VPAPEMEHLSHLPLVMVVVKPRDLQAAEEQASEKEWEADPKAPIKLEGLVVGLEIPWETPLVILAEEVVVSVKLNLEHKEEVPQEEDQQQVMALDLVPEQPKLVPLDKALEEVVETGEVDNCNLGPLVVKEEVTEVASVTLMEEV